MKLIATLAFLATVASGTTPMKCAPTITMPGYDANTPVILLDARIVPPAGGADLGALAGLDPEDVHAVEVTCWRPDLDAFGTGLGEEPALPVIRIHTKALLAAIRAPLEALARAQDAYRAEHGEHARDVAALARYGAESEGDLTFSASSDDWTASTADGLVMYRCTASFDAAAGRDTGNLAVSATRGREAGAREEEAGRTQVRCERRDEVELRVLRERFDTGAG